MENHNQRNRGGGQQQYPIGIREPVADVGKLPGQKAVAGQHRRKLRKAGKRGVCGNHQHQRGRVLHHIKHEVQRMRPGRVRHLPDHALVARHR